jgi:hypothetical protein
LLTGMPKEAFAQAPVLLEQLITTYMPLTTDLGAELLACYWLCGGLPTPAIRAAVRRLKDFSYHDEHTCFKTGDGKCGCPAFKEVAHHKLTVLLGLSMTLLVGGEIL